MTEEDALLTGQRTTREQAQDQWKRWREIGAFVWALLATIVVIVLAVVIQHQQAQKPSRDKIHHDGRPSGKRNLVFMVSDGMGPTSLSLTRSWRQYVDGLPLDDVLVLDKHFIGQSRTRSSNSLITDSAAGATAFSCGRKSYNGAISVTPDYLPCGSVMEAAKRAGYKTGLVVTTRITDATPACFASHVLDRSMDDEIALQLVGEGPLGRSVDLILGGGRCHFLPNSTTAGCRKDGRDVTKTAKDEGWNYISTREEFDALNIGSAVELPLLGLFARSDIPFEIDRRHEDETYPSLEEMARTALRALSDATRDSDQGFFVMIEGSRIDHAGHANDPAAQVHEVLAYDRTVQAVLEFLDEQEEPGIMISTSDHETGGLATARQLTVDYPDYVWYPQALANASHSSHHAAVTYYLHTISPSFSKSGNARTFLVDVLASQLGIHDASDAELDAVINDPLHGNSTMADMISRRSQTGWSTHGHSAVDVNIYASDKHAARKLQGQHENTEVGEFLAWYLELEDEVEKVTEDLKEKLNGTAWLGNAPSGDVIARYRDDYH